MITLEPGQKQAVWFALRVEQLAFRDELKTHDFVVEPGLFDVMFGGSSADIGAKRQLEVVDALKNRIVSFASGGLPYQAMAH